MLIYSRHTSYSSIIRLNPFSDERDTRIGDFYDAQTSRATEINRGRFTAKCHPKPPGMSHSQSEGNLDFRSHVMKAHPRPNLPGHAISHARYSDDSDLSSDHSRGRSFSRTPSPTKLLEDIEEDQAPGFSTSPVKRARSPLKQLFGEKGWLGKSMSMKELPSEEYRKTGIKHWGEKIKQRVEDMVRIRKRSHWSSVTDTCID